MQTKLLTRPDIEALTGLKCSTIYRLMRRGEFPEPIRIGERAVRWPEAEIEAWIASRPRASGNEQLAQ